VTILVDFCFFYIFKIHIPPFIYSETYGLISHSLQAGIVYIRNQVYTTLYCHVYEWQYTGFGLVIGFMDSYSSLLEVTITVYISTQSLRHGLILLSSCFVCGPCREVISGEI
jgi:hypothetical protein